MTRLVTCVFISSIALATACGSKEQPVAQQAAPPAISQQASVATPSMADPAPTPGAAPAPAPAQRLIGKVAETLDSGGYTYLRLATDKGDQWVAVRQTKLQKGSTVGVDAQMSIDNFESNTLHRKFKNIVFGSINDGSGAVPVQAAQPAMAPGKADGRDMNAVMKAMQGEKAGGPASEHMKGTAATGDVSVEKAEGSNARTVAEVWSQRAALNDKPVVVRAKVVKFLGGIMGTNFLHLRDGSGTEAKGDNDITVTTSDTAAIGDVITVTGVVHVDKDFGAGYRYPVIVEGAKVSSKS